MKIQLLNSINSQYNSNAQVAKNQSQNQQAQPRSYKIGTLDALAFKGISLTTDQAICRSMLEGEKILKDGELVTRFTGKEVNMLMSELNKFKTDMKKSHVLNNILNIRTQAHYTNEIGAMDIVNYLSVMSGATKDEQLVVLDILESEVREGASYDTEERNEVIFIPLENSQKCLRTLVKLNNQLKEKDMPNSLKNDILNWIFDFNKYGDKPYIEKYTEQIAQKLADSNLALSGAIDHIYDFCDEKGFAKILPILTVENKEEIMHNDNLYSSLKWKREQTINEFVEKYSN